ncbi:two-component system sensor histidine kinase PprA [Pseudomonas aeruginosa]|uniref:two-component system sensor histidine kinase PprA n=1 Tax=Pseudomonas aeruginosa TaxID=287 RepID=UPI00044E1971|nr:two-component system sensor histidine kinase PprA [Pseudomonas aeruginosa]EZP16754.1 two-component system sensor [Pseudomonas aeruginosa BWH049]
MFEFSRSSFAEAERPEPFSQEGPALWSASLRSWDLCFEMDEQDRVIRVGGRQAYRLQCVHGRGEQPRPFAEYLERRAPGAPTLAGLRRGERLDLTLRSDAAAPLTCRFQPMQPLDGLGRSLLLGMDISDLNWQSDSQQHQLQSLSLGKLILSRLRYVSHGHLAEAVQEILESLSGAFQMQAIALLLGDGKGFCTVFASHVRPGSDSLLRPTLQLADDDLREGAGARLLRRGEGASTLLRQIGEDALYLVPAAMRGGRLGALLVRPMSLEQLAQGPAPQDWQYLAELLANQVADRCELHEQHDSSRKLGLLQEMIGGGWWRYWAEQELFELAPALHDSLGLTGEYRRVPLEHLQGLLQPADADELGLRLRACLRSGQALAQDLCLRQPDSRGERRWLRIEGRPLGRGSALGLSGVLLDISEGRRQEERVQAAHARLRSLIDSAPVVIYVQRVEQGHLVPEFYSESASNLLGLDLQGQSWQALAERVHPDDLEAFFARGRELLREGRVKTRYRLADGQGNWHWLYDEAKLLRDAQGMPSEAVGLWLDVTEQHLAAQRIAESEERYRVLVEDSPALICRYTADLVLTYVNRTFADSLATSPERLVGRRLDEWLAAEDASALRARLLGSPREGASEVPELRFNLPGQRFLWLVWAERPLFDARGELCEVQAVGRDNTPVRRAQQQLAQGAKMASLGEMVSGLAHEVKQPLHVLRMTLFNMRQRMNSVGLDGDYLGEKLERMDAQVLRVDRLVSHLGVFSRKSALEALPFDPYTAFEGALGLLGEGLRQHAIEVECPAPTQRMVVRGQADQLEQVIINLLANARDALLGNLGLASRRVRLEQVACREPGWVELHVHDNGGGIEPLLLERIFEPFFTTKAEGKGTGLGLSVSHDLVRNMGGSLTAANQGEGALFVVRLPLAALPAEADG